MTTITESGITMTRKRGQYGSYVTWKAGERQLFGMIAGAGQRLDNAVIRKINARIHDDPDSALRHADHGGQPSAYISGCCP